MRNPRSGGRGVSVWILGAAEKVLGRLGLPSNPPSLSRFPLVEPGFLSCRRLENPCDEIESSILDIIEALLAAVAIRESLEP